MNKIIAFITKNFISVAGVVILTGTTLATSTLGVIKVANNFDKTKLEVPNVREVESISPTAMPQNKGMSQQLSGSTRTIPRAKGINIGSSTFSVLPTSPPVSTQASTSTVACAITLFGKQYDVSSLRNTHSGGNIFNCGTDMTAVYQAQHGTDLTRMQPYLITSGGTTSSGTSTTSGGSTGTGSPTVSDGQKNDDQNENKSHNDDQKEEEKTHSESFIQRLLQLVIS